MRPSPRMPSLDASPPSPASPWSCTGSQSPSSANQDPLTPDSCFSPAPAIITPDEFTLQIDVQLDGVVGSPHKTSITHLVPQPSVHSPKLDSCFLSGDDVSKVQVFLRNRDRWDDVYHQFESSPPPRHRDAPRVPPLPQASTDDDFSWEAAHSALLDSNDPPDPSRCSLLIHEVSLLVGLTADDDRLSLDDGCPLVPNPSKEIPNVLPLSLTSTKALTSRKGRNASLPHPTNRDVPFYPSSIPISTGIRPRADNANTNLHNAKRPLVGSRDLVAPTPRYETADAGRPYLSPRRRQGQVFHIEPQSSNAPRRNAVVLDETFFHPRQPPPKPTVNLPANRCSSLDRLEHSLRKLEAHAPSNHRKSQSEGWSPDYAAQKKNKRPSLPPPRRLKQQRSSHEIIHRDSSRPAHVCHFLGPPEPVPRPTPLRQRVVPRVRPAVPLDVRDNDREEDRTPNSFMDMDIPHVGEARQTRRTSFQVVSKERMKSLVSIAKRVSRGVIAWKKNLTGPMKPPVMRRETNTVQNASL